MLIKLSGLISDADGKLGGSCWTRNHYGLYQKNWKIPANPISPYSTAVRSNYRTLLHQWATLTQSDQQSWNDLAAQITKTNRVGQTYHPTGFNTFLSCNQNRFLVTEAALTKAPEIPTFEVPLSFTIDLTSVINNIFFLPNPSQWYHDTDLLIYFTKPFSPGINYMKMNLCHIGAVQEGMSGFYYLFSQYATRFNTAFVPNKKYFAKMIPIHVPTGFAALPLTSNIVYLP